MLHVGQKILSRNPRLADLLLSHGKFWPPPNQFQFSRSRAIDPSLITEQTIDLEASHQAGRQSTIERKPKIRATTWKPASQLSSFFQLVSDNDLDSESLETSLVYQSACEFIKKDVGSLNQTDLVDLLSVFLQTHFSKNEQVIKALESEVVNRSKTMGLSLACRLLDLYSKTEATPLRRRLSEILIDRIRYDIPSSARQLIFLLKKVSDGLLPDILLDPIEKRLFGMLSQALYSQRWIDRSELNHELLCLLLINLSRNSRAQKGLIETASGLLQKLPSQHTSARIIIATLFSLYNLDHLDEVLMSKLMVDLERGFNPIDSDARTLGNLFTVMSRLRWRSDTLFERCFKFFGSILDTSVDRSMLMDERVILFALRSAVRLNYDVSKEFLRAFLIYKEQGFEDWVREKPRTWLNYVWNLAMLDLADPNHFESVLSEEFIEKLEREELLQSAGAVDRARILNLRGLASKVSTGSTSIHIHSRLLENLAGMELDDDEKSRFEFKARQTLISMTDEIRHDIHTPFGFKIDCELTFDPELNLTSCDGSNSLEVILSNYELSVPQADFNKVTKCAIIFVNHDEEVFNMPGETLGHMRVIKKILDIFGVQTVFLHRRMMNSELNSASLFAYIRNQVVSALNNTT